MGVTKLELAALSASALISQGVKEEKRVRIYRLDTGAYIYEAFMRIHHGRNTEIWVYKHNKVSMKSRYSQVLSGTQVRVSEYGIEYDNQGGKIKIPDRMSKKLVEFVRELNMHVNMMGRNK